MRVLIVELYFVKNLILQEMKKLFLCMLLVLSVVFANAQKTIIVAFDVTKSMLCPNGAIKGYKPENYEPNSIWIPALNDLENIVMQASEMDTVIIFPFKDDNYQYSLDNAKSYRNHTTYCIISCWYCNIDYICNYDKKRMGNSRP